MTDLQVKAAVRERDGMRCVDCGLTAAEYFQRFGRRLEVHRLTPGSEYTVEGCVTLCKRCHKRKHKKPSEPRFLGQALRPRILFKCSDRLRRAVKIRAAREGLGTSELLLSLIRPLLEKEIEEAAELLAKQQPKPKKK